MVSMHVYVLFISIERKNPMKMIDYLIGAAIGIAIATYVLLLMLTSGKVAM